MTNALEELKTAIAAGNAVVVAGTGVSVAAMGGAEPLVTWKGLLLDGLGQCKDDPIVRGCVEALKGKPNKDQFVMAATQVEAALKEAGRYTAWLNKCLGGLKPIAPELIEAIGALGVPILTTNYDTLISKILGRDPVAWTNAAQLGPVGRGEAKHILHLHGVYTEAESVVLGWPSYTRKAGDGPSQLLAQAIGQMKSFVFIGCGVDGLTDPDLGPFFATYGPLFGTGRHFRLCHESEAAATPHGITPVTYARHEDLPALLRALAPLHPAPARPAYRLERPPEHFVGRDAQRNQLRDRLLAGRPTLITGPAGMGKSALGLAALHDPAVKAQYGDRRWFIRLDGAGTAATMMAKLGEALGLPPEQCRPANVLHELSRSPGALVLDNFETPWDADPQAVEEELAQLGGIAGLAVMVGVRGDRRPMDWLQVRVGRLDPPFDRDLFLVWAGEDFAADAALDGLVTSLEGWPLVLRLLGREAQGQADLADLAELWRQTRLKAADVIAASLDLSWHSPRLGEECRRLLSLLGRLPDGIARADLEVVMPGGRAAAPLLVGIGLAYWSEAKDRLLTLAPIRRHLELAHPPAPEDWAPCRDHYLSLAAAAYGPADGTVFARLIPEAGNGAAVIALTLDDPTAAPRAVPAVIGFAEFHRFTGLGEAVGLLRCAAGMGLGDQVTASCTLQLGMIAADRDEPESAALLTEARTLFARLGERVQEGDCLSFLGDLARGQGRWAAAAEHYAQAEAAFARRSPLGMANCRQDRGDLALFQGRVAEAIPLFRDALRRYRRLEEDLGQGNALLRLAECAQRQGKLRQARTSLQKAIPLYRAAGDIQGEANCHSLEADMALVGGQVEEAPAAIDRAEPLYRQIGDLLGQGNCRLIRGRCAVQLGDKAAAREHFERALEFYASIPDPKSIAMVQEDMAEIATGKERKKLFTQARATFVGLGLEESVKRMDARFPDLAPKAY